MLDTLYFALGLKRPHGSEAVLRAHIMERVGGHVDMSGNLHVCVGSEPTTLFTAHMDTVHSEPGPNPYYVKDLGRTICAMGDVLGADDGAGVAMLVHMILNGVNGHYVFTVGEECGCIGAQNLSEAFLSQFIRAVAFDRRGTKDIITHQRGRQMCSYEFAAALGEALGMGHVPARGIFTDNSVFYGCIPEIVNISVGYSKEHTEIESLNLEYLIDLAEAVLTVDWESLPVGIIETPAESDSLLFSNMGWGGYDDGRDYYPWERVADDTVRNSMFGYPSDEDVDTFMENIINIRRRLQKSLGIPLDDDSWESCSITEALLDAARL